MENTSNSVITISLNRTNLFYFSGEIVSGTVGLNITQRKLKVHKIYITLIGKVAYTTTRTDTSAPSDISSTGVYLTRGGNHHILFYFTKLILARPEPEQEQLIYNRGQYSWPFEISLTNYLPPTMNRPKSYPRVQYYLEVVINKTWYKSNQTETKYITIYPRLNLLQNPQYLTSTVFADQNRKGVILKAIFNKVGYIPGELIRFTLEIENPRKALIKRIDLSMLQSYQIGESTREGRMLQTTLPDILNLKDQQIREQFSILIPSDSIPPSYHFQGGIKRIAIVNICYMLKFAVKVQGILTDFDVDIPIILGTEPNPDVNQEQPLFSDDDPPPNYNFVMQNTRFQLF